MTTLSYFLIISFAIIIVIFLLKKSSGTGLQRMADIGDAEAQFEIAKKYFEKQRFQDAIPYLQESAKSGLAKSKYILSQMYWRGDGIEKDQHLALQLLNEAAEQGLSDAQFELSQMFFNGDNVSQDQKKPSLWLNLLRSKITQMLSSHWRLLTIRYALPNDQLQSFEEIECFFKFSAILKYSLKYGKKLSTFQNIGK